MLGCEHTRSTILSGMSQLRCVGFAFSDVKALHFSYCRNINDADRVSGMFPEFREKLKSLINSEANTMKMKKSDRKFSKAARITLGTLMIISSLLFADAGESRDMTPSDAFASMDLVIRSLGPLMQSKGINTPEKWDIPEKGLRPMHVYRMAVACIDMMIAFENKLGIRPMPKVVATPREYGPADVIRLGLMLAAEIYDVASVLKVSDIPNTEEEFSGKVPTDVFKNTLDVFVRLSILAGMETITPDEVFSQMIRAVSDVKSILSHIDPAQRFRIDAPLSPADATPYHVFRECLRIRQDINTLRKHFNMETIPVPDIPEDQVLHPADVFVQIQIIIAELNLLKMGTGTVSSTSHFLNHFLQRLYLRKQISDHQSLLMNITRSFAGYGNCQRREK